MSGEIPNHAPEVQDLDRALGYLRNNVGFEEDLIQESILSMEVGDSGWSDYWAMDSDTAGRHWLRPLFRLDKKSSNSACALIVRARGGYIIDFTKYTRSPGEFDALYEHVYPAEEIDRVQAERPHWLPVVGVKGRPNVGDYRPPYLAA